MLEKHIRQLLEKLHYYADTFATIPLSNLNDIGKIACQLITSITNYQTVLILLKNSANELELLATKGINREALTFSTTQETLINSLWKSAEVSTTLKTGTMAKDMEEKAQSLGLTEVSLAIPILSQCHINSRIGLVIVSKPLSKPELDLDRKALELIISFVSGAIYNCMAKTSLLESNKNLKAEINERKILEEELTLHHKHLEELVQARTEDLNKINQKLHQEIIERKSMEEAFEGEMLKVQKLEATGVLAGGIAHDFNNLLTAILGNISMAKMFAKTDVEKVFKRLDEAERACGRTRDLTQQLLTFSKGGEPVKKLTHIMELISDSTSFSLTGSNVKCKMIAEDKLWSVNIDEGQISQVIQNLVKNADQAMPDGGAITIRIENKIISEEDGLPLKEGKYVRIVIQDQGIGILKKHISKVFDPYFSTKQEGSGLGLAVTYSIVKKHDGYITVKSKQGKGATFLIYLPATEKTISEKKRAKEKPFQSGGRILIMDDEQVVLDVAANMLSLMGYKTEIANDGSEAIAHYIKALNENQPFDLVLLDLTIPGGMGGKETMQQLTKLNPGIKAIVSSGYANDPIMADFECFGFCGVVPKPYNMEELGEALRDLLD